MGAPYGVDAEIDAETVTAPTGIRRLNINLAEKAFDDLQALARNTKRSMTELVRLGLGLIKIATEQTAKGHRLVITSADGKVLKEIVIPG